MEALEVRPKAHDVAGLHLRVCICRAHVEAEREHLRRRRARINGQISRDRAVLHRYSVLCEVGYEEIDVLILFLGCGVTGTCEWRFPGASNGYSKIVLDEH